MRTDDYPSVEYVCQALRYEDGRLFWLERPMEHFSSIGSWKAVNSRFAGKEAGSINSGKHENDVRQAIKLNGNSYYRSKLAWVICYGHWPDELDHIDGDALNDKVGNLRVCDHSHNMANIQKCKYNTSGHKGVSQELRWSTGKWFARLQVGKKRLYLGAFATRDEANAAYMKAAREHFGEFAREK